MRLAVLLLALALCAVGSAWAQTSSAPISADLRDAPALLALEAIADVAGLKLDPGSATLSERVTCQISDVPALEAARQVAQLLDKDVKLEGTTLSIVSLRKETTRGTTYSMAPLGSEGDSFGQGLLGGGGNRGGTTGPGGAGGAGGSAGLGAPGGMMGGSGGLGGGAGGLMGAQQNTEGWIFENYEPMYIGMGCLQMFPNGSAIYLTDHLMSGGGGGYGGGGGGYGGGGYGGGGNNRGNNNGGGNWGGGGW